MSAIDEGPVPVSAPPAFEEKVKEKTYAQSQDAAASEQACEYPTEEELHTLRRVADKIDWNVYTLAFVELCERFSYYGTTVVCEFPTTFNLNLTDLDKSPISSNSLYRLAPRLVLVSLMDNRVP